MSDIAVSNLTNAVHGMAEGLDSFEQMYRAWKQDLRATVDTVMHGGEASAELAKQRIENELLPRMEHYLTNISSQIGAARSVAAQVPRVGSVAATTGAVQTTGDGTGVAGVPGEPNDKPADGPGVHNPNDIPGTGIVGRDPTQDPPKQQTDENTEAKPS